MDGEHQLVVATEVTANAGDQGGLPVLLDEVRERFDTQPERMLASLVLFYPTQICPVRIWLLRTFPTRWCNTPTLLART